MDITKIPKGWRAIKASVDAANQAAEATRLASIPAPIKASEAYGQHEGKYLKSIPYDRMKVDLTTGARGGVGFSGLQHGVPSYAEARAASGVTDKKTSTRILNRNKDVPEGSQVIWTPSVGALTQHKSNTTMFNQFADKFNKERKNLSDEQLQVLSDRASNAVDNKGRLIFPEGIDLGAKNYRGLIKNYDQRGVVADIFAGRGVGGEKGRTVAVEKMLGENLDPYVADVPTGSLGNRLFTLDNGVIVRPDLHPDYPYILTGEDLGVNYIPVPRENVMETFSNIPRFGKKTGEPRAVTDMDYRMGDPTQLLDNELLSRMQAEGHKKGGEIRKHGHSFEEDLAAAFAEVIAEHNPKPMHGEITVKTSAPVKMGAGGKIVKGLIGAGRRLTSTEKAASDAIGKAAESAGVNHPVMADKMYPPLTNLQDFHTSLMDSVRERTMNAQKQMDSFDYRYEPGQYVFTEHGAKNNLPPFKILEKSRHGYDIVREDPTNPFSKSIIDPTTGKAQRTPYEAGYRVRRENGDDWSEFVIPQTAIKGEVEMAKGGGLRMAMGGAVTSDYNTVPDDNDGGAVIQNPSNFAKGGAATRRNVDELHPLAEVGFQRDIKNSPWYAEFVRRYQEQPDIREGGDYNYRKAWAYGAEPQRDPYDQNSLHWPSALPNGDMLKSDNHATAWKEHFMREYGINPDSIGATKEEFEARQEKPIHMGYGGLAKRALRGLKGTNVAEGNKTSIIKDTGGNWLSGSVEEHLSPLRQIVRGATPSERIVMHNQELERSRGDVSRALIQRDLNIATKEDAIDKWIGGNLTKYVKNQMGTADDPVRKLAEQGIVHKAIPPYLVGVDSRARAGYEQIGVSPEAKSWENLIDYMIEPSTVEDQVEINRLFQGVASPQTNNAFPEPWMAKVDPKTKVYGMSDIAIPSTLGYDHILDVLRADVASGRIRPEQLNKISMEQAVRRTYEYDQEMAKKMRETQAKVTEGMPIKKDYADKGYKWVELALPETPTGLPEGWTLAPNSATEKTGLIRAMSPDGVTVLGKDMPDLVKNVYIRHPDSPGNPKQQLEKALTYEGDTMGHCVGSYCDDVLLGNKRIFSLRDLKGEPHVTIETRPSKKHMYNTEYVTENHPELVKKFKAQPEEGKLSWPSFLAKEAPELLEGNPEFIYQMKAKQNSTEYGNYLPYVQDFIKGDPWTSVGDFGNTGLTKVGGKYLTEAEHAELLANKLKPEGMAKGGLVHMAPGGVVKWASQLAKTINSHKMESMSGEQWMKWLNANAPKSAKKEALASGTLDWLPQQGKVSKGAIIEHMKANAPQIKVKRFGENYTPELQDRFEELRNEGEVRLLTSSERDEMEELEQKLEGTPKTEFDAHVLPGGENYREMTLSARNPTGDDYIVPGAHTYGITEADVNRILHMRMDDRPHKGGKALNIDELQSDWAQRGRSEGFALSKAETGLPSGPYVTDTEDWTKLGLRNAIKEAIEKGHNAVTWTGGEAQAKRYDLSRHLDRIDHNLNADGTYNLSAIKNGSELFSQENIPASKLAEHVGKDAADKIIKGEGVAPSIDNEDYPNLKSLTGLDLQVGGEGMKGYYNQIMKYNANDILKKEMGLAERVSDFDVGTGVPHQGFNITPEMIDYVEKNGLQRFQDGGQAHYNKAEQVVESTQDLIDKFVEMYEKDSGKEPKPPKEVFRDPWHMKDGGAAPRRDVSELMPLDNPHDGMSHGTARPPTMEEMRALQPWKYEEEGLEEPLISPDMLIGTGLPTALAKRLGKSAVGVGKFVAPKANQLLEEYMVKSGMQLNAVPPSELSKLKEYMLKTHGVSGAQRVERAADEIPNLEKMYKQRALRSAFGGDNASAVMVIKPEDFEKYSSPLSSSYIPQNEIDEQVKYLRSVGRFDDVPYLQLYKHDVGEPIIPGHEAILKSRRTPHITGHEGRHRSQALAENGEQSSLVRMIPRAGLREGLPSSSQEEYLDALQKEMAKTDNMVRPEQVKYLETYEIDGTNQSRPAIRLPEMFSEGGVASKRNVNELHPLY